MEWINFKIDNLPPDILTGYYEVQFLNNVWKESGDFNHLDRLEWLKILYEGQLEYRYRKPEPKAPTHKEIITKWWKTSEYCWKKVFIYNRSCDLFNGSQAYIFYGEVDGGEKFGSTSSRGVKKDWFIDKESSDTPPE